MSTIKADNIATLAGVSTSMANAVNGSAKAWVNFNGTFATSPYTVANGGIRGAYNVTSVTDNGTGQYTVNFTNPINGSYVVVSELSDPNSTNPTNGIGTLLYSTSSTSLRIHCGLYSSGYYDTPQANIAVFA